MVSLFKLPQQNYPGLFSTAIMLSPFNKKHQRQALEDHKGGAC